MSRKINGWKNHVRIILLIRDRAYDLKKDRFLTHLKLIKLLCRSLLLILRLHSPISLKLATLIREKHSNDICK